MVVDILPCLEPGCFAYKAANTWLQYDLVEMMEAAFPTYGQKPLINDWFPICHDGYENAVYFNSSVKQAPQ